MTTPFNQPQRQDLSSFATKSYVESQSTVLGVAFKADPNPSSYNVASQNQVASGLVLTSIGVLSNLNPIITLKSATSKVIVDVTVNGEWNRETGNKGIILMRIQNGVPASSRTIFGTNINNSGNRGRTISALLNNGTGSGDNSLDSYSFRYVDDFTFATSSPISVGDTLQYAPVVANFDGQTSVFNLNKTVLDSQNNLNRERGYSSIILTEVVT